MTQKQKKATKELVIQTVRKEIDSQKVEFFHDSRSRAWATIPRQGHWETLPVRSKRLRFYLMQIMFDRFGFVDKKQLNALIDLFETEAVCGGANREIYIRVAKHEGIHYLDLGDDQWKQIRVTSKGWKLLDEGPAKFRRTEGMAALPTPVRGASLKDLLRFLNVSARDQQLLLTWLIHAYRYDVPYPVLNILGPPGYGKSTVSKICRGLIDPSVGELTEPPNSRRDLAIAAHNAHLLVMDNLSKVTDDFSDAICRIATGATRRNRKLFTDSDEEFFNYRRPQVINGIEDLAVRSDLLDRSLLIYALEITEENRIPEEDFWAEFNNRKGEYFGALLDVLSVGLKEMTNVKTTRLPRMADFARFGIAIEKALGYAEGSFMKAYGEMLSEIKLASLEGSPIGLALLPWLKKQNGHWKGPALKLLEELRSYLDHGGAEPHLSQLLKHPKFPKTANALSGELNRLKPILKKSEILFNRHHDHRGRFIELSVVSPGKKAAA